MARRETCRGHCSSCAWRCASGRRALRVRRRRRARPHQGPGSPRSTRASRATACRCRPRTTVLAGERRALAERHGRAGRAAHPAARAAARPTSRDHPWDPALVAANAQRAADDPTAMAYLGELDYGATAVSLPITNKAGLLQVSPGDGLTSLTRARPGDPAPGPSATTRADRRSFVRVGPSDLDEARAARRPPGRARGASAWPSSSTARSTAASWRRSSRRSRATRASTPVAAEEYRGRVDDIPDIARKLGEARARRGRPRSCVAGPRGPIPMLVLDRAPALPGAPVLASSGILALPELGCRRPSPRRSRRSGRRSARSAPATRPCALVLDAIERGGRDRRRVIAAGARRSADLLQPTRVVALPGPARTGI